MFRCFCGKLTIVLVDKSGFGEIWGDEGVDKGR